MHTFVDQAACRGLCPAFVSGVPGAELVDRKFLVARLLKERGRIRALVAPTGFGKSLLVHEYASKMFSYWHVFYFDAQDLRFLRALDDQGFCDDLLKCDPQAALVIFDDVPMLNASQQACFKRDLAKLLAAGCEVLVCTTPVCASTGCYQDCFVMEGRALLAQASELSPYAADYTADAFSSPAQATFARIPALAWGVDEGASLLLRGFAFDELGFELCLTGLCLFSLGSGQVSELHALLGPRASDYVACLARSYSFFSYDAQSGMFFSLDISDDLFSHVLLALVRECAAFSEERAEADLLADYVQLFVERRSWKRAACAALHLFAFGKRSQWLCQYAPDLLFSGHGESFQLLADSLRAPSDLAALVQSYECLEQALSMGSLDWTCAQMVASNSEACTQARLICAILCLQTPCSPLPKEVLLRQFAGLTQAGDDAVFDGAVPCDGVAREQLLFQLSYLINTDFDRAFSCWSTLLGRASAEERFALPLQLGALWLAEKHIEDEHLPHRAPVIDYLTQALASAHQQDALRRGCLRALPLLKATPSSSGPSRFLYQAMDIPPLRINLWGSFSLAIGTRALDAHSFTRKKSLTLLALLASDTGRDFPRDYLVESLWPDSSLSCARRNLYTVWSDLRHALSLEDGSCPYLVHKGEGYRVEESLVECDVQEAERLCQTLRKGAIQTAEWMSALDKLSTHFAGDPFPHERQNDEIDRLRNALDESLTDSLVYAATRLADQKDYPRALLFARQALQRRQDREDAYEILMRVQYALGQRASALSTYFTCQRYLSQQLGIDPSARLSSLYERLLDGGEV